MAMVSRPTSRRAGDGANPVAPFGDDPRPGCALTVALTAAPPAGATVTLGVATPDGRGVRVPDVHHDAVVAWEVQAAGGAWVAAGVEVDGTRALTRDGRVVLHLPDEPLGPALRVRHVAGAFDAAPWLSDLVVNGAEAEQAVALTGAWTIAPDAVITGMPVAGAEIRFAVELDRAGRIARLDTADAAAPAVSVLAAGPAELVLAARRLGRATGDPEQRFEIPGAPVDARSLHLLAGHGSRWRRFIVRDDLRGSGPTTPTSSSTPSPAASRSATAPTAAWPTRATSSSPSAARPSPSAGTCPGAASTRSRPSRRRRPA